MNYDIVKNHPERNRLMNSAITHTNVKSIDELAKNVGIEWFCTPMYPEAVNFLEPFVDKFKVREVDGRPLLKNKISDLIRKILDAKKEVFVSSQISPRNSKYYKNSDIKWLYCVPKYPCDISDLDFKNIKDFNGFSNHCPDLIAPLTAKILGSEIIEVHMTSDKSSDFVDNNVSFDYDEMSKLVSLIRKAEKIKY